ncbi:Phosphatidylserine/phosphatidylglycerophosphate (plasmid) [Paraburkholderia caribensis MBA4]|uniref:phospholipase D n=1 Tax=Paraburkholderia caribensis MBA4 TaxID=1323664 RepID=A0A0P0RQS4_9BURK|nr:phospholipase D-like domain-containing protein [Paraburkholderia caribensis]ALL71377.1 Phosphatidylserine/phosphatidylglycerophosphate [Paraburkholderia caribensis MBA4]
MTIKVNVHTNGDDALVVWGPDPWDDSWAGFRLERRNTRTEEISLVNNRIPPVAGAGEVPAEGIASDISPIRRCMWTDHTVSSSDSVAYRVTPMKPSGTDKFMPVEDKASEWTPPKLVTDRFADGLSACFNRGTIMSQVVSRIVGEVSVASLKAFKAKLDQPSFPGRRYLSGDARHAVLDFMADADRRGNEVFAALYEINDQELIDGLKAFSNRAHVLIGNGSATGTNVANELEGAGAEVHHRDLSHSGRSSPSVHNKFLVEVSKSTKKATRVLTGSTNWTTTGLCTQLNNVLVIERPATAQRFHRQWEVLVASGDDMLGELKEENGRQVQDGPVTTFFAATQNQLEFAPVLELLNNATDGLLFLMFTPGESPLLLNLLDRAMQDDGCYIRGVVSEVRESANGRVTSHDAVVVKKGVPPEKFHDTALLPNGLPQDNLPSWAREEFQRRMYLPAGLNAIIHSKVIVVDPFSDDCAVVTGSHNFSPAASEHNDENLVIVRGNKALAQAYALHIEGIYDHFAWRAFLSSGGNPDQIFKPLDSWKPRGSHERELKFWLR